MSPRALAKTEAFEQSRRNRKRGEMLFAHLKRVPSTRIPQMNPAFCGG
jgi:hypothetical protein